MDVLICHQYGFKNVIAIGAGIFDGLKYGESSKSAFISYASREIEDIAISLGGKILSSVSSKTDYLILIVDNDIVGIFNTE